MGSTRLLEPRFAGFGRREGRIWAREPRIAGFGTLIPAKPRKTWRPQLHRPAAPGQPRRYMRTMPSQTSSTASSPR